MPRTLLAEGFRRAVLDFLVKNEALAELRKRMLARGHSGFSAHNAVRAPAEDAKRHKKLAGTMLRAPMSLEKMTCDAATGTVIYRSKMHAGLKRNFQVVPGAQWLALRCKHLADRYEHLGLWAPRAMQRSAPLVPRPGRCTPACRSPTTPHPLSAWRVFSLALTLGGRVSSWWWHIMVMAT
ncbi:MAG: hypothetical protein HY525_11420 [Betaproteobacteria bacterium]|nr:hypothetical protein [Betaproteobacteria bacterium]